MIAVLDLRSKGNTHIPFNTALIRILLRALDDRPILIMGETEHLRLVQHELPSDDRERLRFQSITVPSETWRLELQFLRFLWHFHRHIRALAATNVTRVVVPYGSSPMILAAWILLKTVHRNLLLDIILHGDLTTLGEIGSRSHNPFRHLFGYRMSISLARLPRLRFVVLEETIKDAVLKQLPSCASALAVFPHPILPSPRSSGVKPPGSDNPFVVAHLGLATLSKGFDTFVELARMALPGIAFRSIGHLHSSLAHLDTSCLERQPSSHPLPRDQFERSLSEVHYVCIPYHGQYYEYAASGVLMDAIAFGKPVIAIQTPLLKDLLKRYGPIGHVFTDKRELAQFVAHLRSRHDPEEYRMFKKNMQLIVEDRSVSVLAKRSIWRQMNST